MSPEEWANEFAKLLQEHADELAALEQEMYAENGWTLAQGHDGDYAVEKWIDDRLQIVDIDY